MSLISSSDIIKPKCPTLPLDHILNLLPWNLILTMLLMFFIHIYILCCAMAQERMN